MEKNILKMSAIIMIMLLMMFCISTTVEASGISQEFLTPEGTASPTYTSSGGTGFDITITGKDSPIKDEISNTSNDIIWIVQAVGYAAATIILVVLAIKYLAASPTDKAEIKKSATIWVVGALILFAGSFILTMIDNFAGSIFGSGT